MSKLKVLYVSSEINPFLAVSEVGNYVRKLPQAMQEKGMEVRILVPRFGVINERKNRLHEVVRLSGLNINVGDEDRPLTIKVASIPAAKLQVYFIDNEEYFPRKMSLVDKNDEFVANNDEKAIFFCKGVIQTVKKLGWIPDIVHCNDWMSALIPLYLKTTYKNDPSFNKSKIIFTAFDTPFEHKFEEDMLAKVKMLDVEDEMMESLKTLDFNAFVKTGCQYADCITISSEATKELIAPSLSGLEDKDIRVIEANDEYLDTYSNLYQEFASVNSEA